MKIVSLFTGAGGLDLGLHAAGFQTSVAVEFDKRAIKTLSHPDNAPWWAKTKILPWDVTKISPADVLDASRMKPGRVAILAGGPPCQPFSKSGFWHSGESKRLADPRAKTLEFFLDMIEFALPEVVLLENVPGIRFSQKDEGIRFVQRRLAQINKKRGTKYVANVEQLLAVEYGVPQTRERVFVIAHVDGKEFNFPRGKYRFHEDSADQRKLPSSGRITDEQPCFNAWDAIGHLGAIDDPELAPKGKYGALLPSIPEGKNYLYHTERGDGLPLFGWRTRYWSMLLKLAKTRPSWTLTAQPGPAIGPFHWDNRRLSAPELCALQTFPQDYRIVGTVLDAHRQLGNAVPSLLSEVLGREIRIQLFGDSSGRTGDPELLPRRSTKKPVPSAPVAVPDRYLRFQGSHPEHPGSGKGPGARSRGDR